MFVALALQILGLTMASLPTDLRRQNGVLLLSVAWIAICLVVIAIFVVVLPEYYPVWLGKDRITYDAEYVGAVEGASPDFEIGFSLLTDLVASLTSNSAVYFILIFIANIALFHVLISYLFRPADWIIVYFFYFNYFAFFQATLNLIRQGLGIALSCVAIVCFLKNRLRLSSLLIILASLIHSASIFTFAIFLIRIRGVSVWWMVAAVFAVFALSIAGVTEFVFDGLLSLTGIYPKHLIEYTLVSSWREYSGGIHRIDFLLFSLVPLIPYAYFNMMVDIDKESAKFNLYEKLMLMYVALVIPFGFFSYMTFSDRYLMQAWMLLPLMVIWPPLYMEEAPSRGTWAIRTVLLTLVAVLPNVTAYEATLLRICREIL